MFNVITNAFKKIYSQFSTKVAALFSLTTIDEPALKKLEQLLLEADTGVKTTQIIMQNLRAQLHHGTITKGSDMQKVLEEHLRTLLANRATADSTITLLVGINGSGKTTSAGKLAHRFAQAGDKVLLVAADTFRAAAVQQLALWADKANVDIWQGTPAQEPAAVVFAGCEQFKKGGYTKLIIDTAGRLQTKANLMKELEKIKKIVERQLSGTSICTLLTIDAMLGQNSLDQARLFNESTALSGIILTKMDGTGKGGIVFSITQELNIPIAYVSFGESLEAIAPFDPQTYITGLMQG